VNTLWSLKIPEERFRTLKIILIHVSEAGFLIQKSETGNKNYALELAQLIARPTYASLFVNLFVCLHKGLFTQTAIFVLRHVTNIATHGQDCF
jgi:hypothetical protein